MRIIQENIAGPVYRSRILEEYFSSENMVIADIETTGLSPRSSQVILGGMIMPDGDDRLAVQYFADSPEDEEELLDRYTAKLAEYDVIVTYNGNAFDLPFLKKRMKTHRIGTERLERCCSMDLYRILKKYSGLPEILPDLKQKTVEKYMGAGQARRDTIDGAESVRLYYQYVRSRGAQRETLLDRILLHNRDDIVKLSDIMSILSHLDLHEIMYAEGCPVRAGNVSAVIRNNLVNSRGVSIEGDVSGAAESYRSFTGGVEVEVDKKGHFFIRFGTEKVGGYSVADLKAIGADFPELRELPGYESGYLILRDPEKKIRYREANRLAGALVERLLGEIRFPEQIRIIL